VVPDRRAALEQLVLHATSLRIPVVEVEGGTLTAVSGFDGHQGIALVVEPRRWATLDDVLARARERGEAPFVLVLDSLEDPQNVGTLLRTADACGVHGVLFPTRHSAPISPAAVKASAGAVEHLLLVPLDDLGGGLVDLHSRGLRIVGADEKAALSYRDADLRGPLALAVGSEGHGISGGIRRRLDLAVRIPMHGQVASLNVAVAGSVLLFEAAAQRPHGEPAEVGEREHLLSEAAALSGADATAEPFTTEPAAAAPKVRRTRAVTKPVSQAAEPEAAAPKVRRGRVVPKPATQSSEAAAAAPKARRGRAVPEPALQASEREAAAPKPKRTRAVAKPKPGATPSDAPATVAGTPVPAPRAARSRSTASAAEPRPKRSRAKPKVEPAEPDDLLPGETR